MVTAPVEVAAGVVADNAGRILIAQRPAGKPQAGAWEFPGGKRHADETPLQALRRELAEELGIDVLLARHLLRYEHTGGGRPVRLYVWRVLAWSGAPAGREGQALRWLRVPELLPAGLLQADEPIVAALSSASAVNTLPVEACFSTPSV